MSHAPLGLPRRGLARVALAASLVLAVQTGAVFLTTGQSFAVASTAPASAPANTAPEVPSTSGLTSWTVNPFSGLRYTKSVTPTLVAKSADPDGQTYQAQFELSADPAFADTTYTYTGTSPVTASGVNALLSVPSANALPDGKHLRVRARAYDGTDYSGWTGYTAFAVDLTRPAAPAVSCAAYPSGSWTAPAPGATSCTFTTTSSDGQGYDWGLDDSGTPNHAYDTTTGTGGTPQSVSITPGNGWHTVYVRTVDVAGNVSTNATAYSFGVGADGVALLTPVDGDRTARRLPLTSKGRTDYTGATYEYRLGETDTWKSVPAANVTKASDGSAVTWPVAVTAGSPAALNWDATTTLAADGPVEVRARFTNATTTGYSQGTTVTVDRRAGSAPRESIGPGSLNTLTGDFTLSGTDVSVFGLSAARTATSRQPDAGAQQAGQVAVFGPQWTSGSVAQASASGWSYLQQTSPTSVSVVDAQGAATGFTATSAGGWKPEIGFESLTLTGQPTGSFTLKDTSGATTVFSKVDSASTAWNATVSSLPTADSASTVVSEKVVNGASTLARPKYLVAPTSAVSQDTCKATPSTKGCRVLEYVYATSTTATSSVFGDYTGRVTAINLWATTPGASASTSTAVARYSYDDSGRLREVWDPRLTTPLKTAYTYDSSGRVATLTPPGELPWTMTYGQAGSTATAGPGMLLAVSRPTLQSGTASTVSGTATTSVVYGVPVSGTRAPYAMAPGDVAAWGQRDLPTDATAIFPADQVPASHDGSTLASSDYRRAVVDYADSSGRAVNTVQPGGHTSTSEYNRFGTVTRSLTAANRAVALGLNSSAVAAQNALGISELASDDRADLLSTTSLYNSTGTRLLEEFGPLQRTELAADFKSGSTVVLPAGTAVSANSWAVHEYDTGRPTDGSATVQDQRTITTAGLRVLGYDSILAEKHVTETQYDWVKGLPNESIQDSGGLGLTTATGYNAQGRVNGVNLPGSNGDDAASRTTAYWSGTGTGSCKGRPEFADLQCWTGPNGDITGGGSNPSALVDTVTTYNRYGQIDTKTDTSGSAERDTTTTYDAAGRPVTTTITATGSQQTPTVTTAYDQTSGRVTTSTSTAGGTITRAYDKLGRLISYTDADGGVTTSTFDDLDRPVRVTDSAPSTVDFTYDTAIDPRGLPTSEADSVAGTFTATYDPDGVVVKETLPGGYTLTQTRDANGAPTSRIYTKDSDGSVVLADDVTRSVLGQVTTDNSTAGGPNTHHYSYDKAGRLTQTTDTANSLCTLRTYTLDKRANRVAQSSAVGAAGAGCPSSGPTISHTYDSGDRLTDIGYTYDAFGRSTTVPGSSLSYYGNDLAYRETTGSQRETWSLDSGLRFRVATTETNTSGTWTVASAKTNHYAGDGDSPRWITEDATAGTISRNVSSLGSGLAATTGRTGGTVLVLTNIHGDASIVLPLANPANQVVLHNDEFGIPATGQAPTRYGWLASQQRTSDTPSGLVMMGVRMYNPVSGRFLQNDPVQSATVNSYDYVGQDPVARTDISGAWRHMQVSWGWSGITVRFDKTGTADFNDAWWIVIAALAAIPVYGWALGLLATVDWALMSIAARHGYCGGLTVKSWRPTHPSYFMYRGGFCR